MIVYQENKETFMSHVRESKIEYIIHDNFKRNLGRDTNKNEVLSWKNSMQYMRNVLDDNAIPGDAKISIECQVPNTSKRIDFIITGQTENGQDCGVIIELKQWETAAATDLDGVVKTYVGGGIREVSHPSYQAWSYAALLEGFNTAIEEQDIYLQACAFLHNCSDPTPLTGEFYSTHLQKAPLFAKNDVLLLSDFIKKHVKYGDSRNVMYQIENGKNRPSKGLADAISKMIEGNDEFVMIDEQKVVYERIWNLVEQSSPSSKHVVIVKGGPGTGKSVVAIQLTARLTAKQKLVQYVSKNSAPRDVYASQLSGIRSKSWVNNLFKGSGSYINAERNQYDALLVDEAHRLNEKSGMFSNLGENQIKEIINAARCSVFFLDENQRVTMKDIGSESEISRWAVVSGATLHQLELTSQFRCNGSDGFMAFLDNMLDIRETANTELSEIDFDFQICKTPNDLYNQILTKNNERNRARMVAGYCWPWNSKNDKKAQDIIFPEYNFAKQWNLTQDGMLWIISPDSVEQIGCIHTCQGLEVDYIGVIMGPDLIIRDGKWVCQPSARASSDKSIHGIKSLLKNNPQQGHKMSELIIKNTYRTLMTRGMKGCYVWSCDDETLQWLTQRTIS